MLVCCCCSVTKSCLTLCDPMDSSFAKLALNLTKVSERKSAFWISNELPYTPIWRVLHSLCFLDSGCIRKVHLLILLVKFQFLPLKHWLCASTCGSPHWGLSLTTPLSSTTSCHLLKFMSTESVMLSNSLIFCLLLSFCFQSFPASGSFQWVHSLHQVAKVLEFHHQSFQWTFRTDFL